MFCVVMFLGMFLVAITPTAWGQEDFYWKNNYGRGAGTIPSIHGCKNGKEKQAGLCYQPCKAGYHGAGPVCWENGPKSYGRGVGKPLVSECKTGMEADAGLCYPKCKTDFHGIGPVCWGNTPSGYVACGAGFAKDSQTCAKITAEQVAAVGIFLGTTVVPEARAARNAEKMAQEGAKGKETFQALRPLMNQFKATFKNVKTSKPGTMVSQVKKQWNDLSAAQRTRITTALKLTKEGTSVGIQASNGQVNPIDILRYASSLASAFDPSGVLSVAAAYTYPVYGVNY